MFLRGPRRVAIIPLAISLGVISTILPGLTTASLAACPLSQISAGFYYTCGIQSDGRVRCWGNNDYGQSVPPSGLFTSISADFVHACGIRTDGSVQCWGDNSAGESSPPAGAFSAISVGAFYACGIRNDGSVQC